MSENEDSQPKSLSVYDAVVAMIDQMASIAWSKLGLQPDLLSGRLAQDLSEAKVAIDLTTHLATFVEPRLEEDDRRQIHNLVRDLRLNYVQKLKEASGDTSGSDS